MSYAPYIRSTSVLYTLYRTSVDSPPLDIVQEAWVAGLGATVQGHEAGPRERLRAGQDQGEEEQHPAADPGGEDLVTIP